MAQRPAGDTLKEIERTLAPLAGKRVLDIGCGQGLLAKALSERGARVGAVDPDADAVAAAAKTAPSAFVRQAGAEALPFPDASAHAAIFLNSLHHVPLDLMATALREAARVVVRGGAVLIVEPLAEGTFFEALRPIEDETRVRLAAQDAVAAALAEGVLHEIDRREYDRVDVFGSVSAFIERAVGADPARKERALEAREKVMRRFDTLAERLPQGYVLRQPLRLHHLVKPR